jgi:hypothetical protein
MRNARYGIVLAVSLTACTFTTADVGPTATSLRTAHDALSREFTALDAELAPSKDQVQAVCEPGVGRTPLVDAFCAEWAGLDDAQRTRRARELSLQPRIDDTLTALLGYIQALDALVKSRERSAVQADLLKTRLTGLGSASAALGGSASVFSASASALIANAAASFDHYTRTRAALRAAEQAQPGLDLLAIGVRDLFGECDVTLSVAMRRRLQSTPECNSAARAIHVSMVRDIVVRRSVVAEVQNEVAYTLYQSEAPRALERLRGAYDARAEAEAGSAAYDRANRDVDAALRDIEALERVRSQYDAVITARREAEEWERTRTRGRRATVEAFLLAADQNAALAEAIRRDRQLDLGPVGFLIRSLLGV